MNRRKILALLLCFLIGFNLAACATQAVPVPSESSLAPSSEESKYGETTFANTLELPAGPYAKYALPKFTQQISDKYALNSDTVGWLKLENTTIDDVILWYPGDKNQYYYRRNFDKRESFNGCYYADYRSSFDGTAAGLSPNTVIYGHSMSDDPLDARKLFSPLKLFKDETFARENPYVYFSAADEDLVWEVFAVFYATVSLPYNNPNPPDLVAMVEECKARSIYNYDTQVSATDKILTLSTCTYSLPNGTPIAYPNNYRYVVMAKLVTDKDNLMAEAKLEKNPSPKAP